MATQETILRITSAEADPVLAAFYDSIAAGPMTDYRYIAQSGGKGGQTYYAHALDGINVLHKLRAAGVVQMTELEEQLLLIAFAVHDINKIEPYGGRDSKVSYAKIATVENVSAELKRLGMETFLTEWPEYIEDIRLLMELHQHDKPPLYDLDLRNRPSYKLPQWRLEQLGKLMYAVDNLDLSHSLAERDHKDVFITSVNAVSMSQDDGEEWGWVRHRLGENRGLLSNIIHNCVVDYLRDQHPRLIDLLYYPEGVAYLLPKGEQLTWTTGDIATVAQRVADAVARKQGASIVQFIKPRPAGVKVDKAAMEGGASYSEIMDVIYSIVERKRYKEDWYSGYATKLGQDIADAAAKPATAELAKTLLAEPALAPYSQDAFQRGELAGAYRNLLEDHLKDKLKSRHQRDPWLHIYTLLKLPAERYALYNQVDPYRRGYFIARDNRDSLDSLFDHLLADVNELTGEHEATPMESKDFREYLTTNLEVAAASLPRNFKAQLARYIKDEHRQCSNCSSAMPTESWVIANAPTSIGVQNFSNRLVGGSSREPGRNICPICRAQFILEKLVGPSHRDKHGGESTSFYLHLYPYSFFTKPYLEAIWQALKETSREDSTALFLRADIYFPQKWAERLGRKLQSGYKAQAGQIDAASGDIVGNATKVNGIALPSFSDAVGNTPTLAINAPGDNYGEQFLFALTHALMIVDFFGCRVVMSRTPVPLFTSEYLDANKIAFFADGAPRNLRWLLPANEYRSLETYWDEGEKAYTQRRDKWGNEQLDTHNQAAMENISKRLATLYQLSRQLTSNEGDAMILDLATAAADDPLAIYYIVDRAIEKRVKDSAGGKGKAAKASNPELLATSLSKRIAPLLNDIVKE